MFHFMHRWTTTHTNRWHHPTRQECKCGLVREMSKVKEGNGMPWERVEWIDSNGKTYKYSVLD